MIRSDNSEFLVKIARVKNLSTSRILLDNGLNNQKSAVQIFGKRQFQRTYPLSQYIHEAYEHTDRKGHPQIAWKIEETVSILQTFLFPFIY